MRAVVQRVTSAQVDIDGETVGSIGRGIVILLGIGHEDTEDQAERLWSKIGRLRIFEDESGKTNLSLADVGGEVLVVSQFTLFASCKRETVLRSPTRAHPTTPSSFTSGLSSAHAAMRATWKQVASARIWMCPW